MHLPVVVVVTCALTLVSMATAADSNGQNIVSALTRQLMMEQLMKEEQLRAEGSSGLKQVRVMRSGTRPYFQAAIGDGSVAAIHDHANNVRTVGMGEFMAVLNGVEFRTRHNDYRLYQPSKTSKEYHAVDPIEFPPVPPEVLGKSTVQEQIEEMWEYFKAWKLQDSSIRNYKPYFKPTLCYLEGAWTKSTNAIDESFDSDRHFLDAATWFDLQEKIRFSGYTGRKSPLENYAFLPTSLMGMINDTIPDFAQWNYRILCQPLKDDLPLNKLRVIDDLAPRMKFHTTMDKFHLSRSARFQLSPDSDPSTGWSYKEQFTRRTLLDDLMAQIPGKDNGPADIVDDAFDTPATELGEDGVVINSGRYHRWFEFGQKDAMGISMQRRGYADDQLFMAMTTNPKVASKSIEDCRWVRVKAGKRRQKVCKTYSQRWTYAIPLEIIYLTPLYRWNPYDIEYKGDARDQASVLSVTKDVDGNSRNGGMSLSKAYNGTSSKLYYITPSEFYTGKEINSDAADTSRGSLGVLDRLGNVRSVRAAGTRIVIPSIPGVGPLRTRYPIMPMYYEGNPIYKEIEALKDIVMYGRSYRYMLVQKDYPDGVTSDGGATFEMSPSNREGISEHTHEVTLTSDEIFDLSTKKDGRLTKTTTQANGHSHTLVLKWKRAGVLLAVKCDNKPQCFDKHGRDLNKEDDS